MEKSIETVAGNMSKKEDKSNNEGKLFLRFFSINTEVNEKVITKLQGKVYFPVNPDLKPGWYIASIVKEKENYGVMDTLTLEEVPYDLLNPKYIIGIHVKPNYRERVLEIYKSLSRDRMETDESPCIARIPMVEKGNTIEEIVKAKLQAKTEEQSRKTKELPSKKN